MPNKQPFDELYETLVVQSSTQYRAGIGEPVHLDRAAFGELLIQLKNFRELYPNMAFWLVIDYKNLTITHSDGDLTTFGEKLRSLKEFYRHIHPDYLLPYLRWRSAAYDVIFKGNIQIDPLEINYRQTIPIATADGSFFWFTSNGMIVQIDANNRPVTHLQTFYRDTRWSPRNLRPFEPSLQLKKSLGGDLETRLIDQLSLRLIDEFTNAELDVLSLYASGKSAEEVMRTKNWSRHTLHEYNANLLKKAKALFVYDFRNARDFAEYCFEKGFIRVR